MSRYATHSPVFVWICLARMIRLLFLWDCSIARSVLGWESAQIRSVLYDCNINSPAHHLCVPKPEICKCSWKLNSSHHSWQIASNHEQINLIIFIFTDIFMESRQRITPGGSVSRCYTSWARCTSFTLSRIKRTPRMVSQHGQCLV